jgi:hypothetical protein
MARSESRWIKRLPSVILTGFAGVVFVLLLPTTLVAQCSGASPNWVAATFDSIAACHTLAQNGDTITVAHGTYHAVAEMEITKYVHIRAEGLPHTPNEVFIIDDICDGAGENCLRSNLRIVESTLGSTSVDGFRYQNGIGIHRTPGGFIYVLDSAGGKPVLIRHLDITDTTSLANYIYFRSNKGVVYQNTYSQIPQGVGCIAQSQFVQSGPLQNSAQWATPAYAGMEDVNGDQNLYVEGNTLFNGITDLMSNGRVVARYNSITNAASLSIHGVTFINGRLMDNYNNEHIRDQRTWPGPPQTDCASPQNMNGYIRIGGGVSYIHNTLIADPNDFLASWGNKNAIQLTNDMMTQDYGLWPCWDARTGRGEGYPSPQQPGWGFRMGQPVLRRNTLPEIREEQDQTLDPIYLWHNGGTGNYGGRVGLPPGVNGGPLGTPLSCDMRGIPGPFPEVADYIQEGREYYTNISAPNGKPDYVPYTCPHPATGLTGTCDPASYGAKGYNVSTLGVFFYHRQLTIQPSAVGNTAQHDFTVLVCANGPPPCNQTVAGLNQNGGGAHVTSAAGYDIRPYLDPACEKDPLFYKLEHYTPATGEFSMRVKLFEVSGSAPTNIYLCYGNTARTTDGSTAGVWDSVTQLAYEFEDLPNVTDSSGYTQLVRNADRNGTNHGSVTSVAGRFGRAAHFDGTPDSYITSGLQDLSFTTRPPAILHEMGTISWWMKPTEGSTSMQRDMFWGYYSEIGLSRTFACQKYLDQLILCGFVRGSGGSEVDGRVIVNLTPEIYPQGQWVKYDFTWKSGADSKLYVNGQLRGSAPTPVVDWGFRFLAIGTMTDDTRFMYKGDMDQFIVSNDERSASEIAASYANESAPGTFMTIGNEVNVSTAMVFTQQPTNTVPFSAFHPAVAVRVPGLRQGDSLTLSINNGPCTLPSGSLTVTTDAMGTAVFNGVTVGGTENSTCGLRAVNNTETSLTPAISNTFNLIPQTVVNPCANTDLGHGWTCVAAAGDHLGANGGTSTAIDTTNAGPDNLLVIGLAAHELVNPMCGGQPPTDNKGNVYTPLGKTVSQGSAVNVQMFYKANGVVGTGHTISCAGVDTYPVSIFAAYKPADPSQTVVEAGNSSANPATSIQPGSVTPNQANALVLTTLGTSVLAGVNHSIGSNFHIVNDVPGQHIGAFGGNIGGSMAALTIGTPAAVNPTWTWSSQTEIPATRIAVFNTVSNVPMYTLSFVTQPMTTVSGVMMTPFIVSTSPAAPNGLTVTLTPNNCPAVDFTNLTGQTFGGNVPFALIVPTGTGSGCTFSASMLGGTTVMSSAFNVTPNVPPAGIMSVVNNSNAYGCAVRTATSVLDMTTQHDGMPFNTTGADLIIAVMTSGIPDPGTFSDQLSGVPTSNQWNLVFDPPLSSDAANAVHRIWWTHPTQTGANASFHMNASLNNAAGLCVIALQGGDGMGPVAMGEHPSTSNEFNIVFDHQAGNYLVMSTLALIPGQATFSQGPAGFESAWAEGGTTHGNGMAWKFMTDGMENPHWVVSLGVPGIITFFMFAPNNVAPVLSFQTQPSTTQSAQTMSTFIVSHTGTLLGNVTLIPDCPGVNFTGLEAMISGSTATFSMVVPTGMATNCSFTATAPGATSSAPSNLFNVTPAPVPTLVFTSQPSTTQSGATMTPFIVTAPSGVTGNVTLQANGCAGVAFAGLQATISGTTATFNAVVPTGIAAGCSFTASVASGANPASSMPFDVTGIPLGLSFTQHPTDTVNGGAFNPPIAGRKTVATTK